jgi:hypothetical protein
MSAGTGDTTSSFLITEEEEEEEEVIVVGFGLSFEEERI